MLLSLQGIEKFFADRLIFKFDTLKVHRGDKIGIVGNNGEGKSTLLKVLCGKVRPDSGRADIKAVVSLVDQLDEDAEQSDDMHRSIFKVKENAKSGGEIMRRKLAAAFSLPFDILALDEPTSNLDVEGIETLDGMLAAVETLLLISHDKQLLDRHCNKIIEVRDSKLTVFNGGFSEYEQAARELSQRHENLYEEYSREKRRLERAIRETAQRASSMKKTPSRMGNSEARLHKREANTSQAKVLSAGSTMVTRLERMEAVERPNETKFIKPDFSLTNPPQNNIVLSCQNLNFSYGNDVIFRAAKFEIKNGLHVALTGKNASGKTTLLKTINERPDIVYRVPKLKIGYMRQDFSDLDFEASILQNILGTAVQNQTVCRNILANMGFKGDDVHKKAGVLSGGELIKVSLSRLIASDCNMLLLDEPTNYLDINSIIRVQNALINYDGTLFFVSHDYSFIKAVANQVLTIRDKNIIEEPVENIR